MIFELSGLRSEARSFVGLADVSVPFSSPLRVVGQTVPSPPPDHFHAFFTRTR